jgi:hypothetical protein
MYFNKQNEAQISKTRQRIDALKSSQDNTKPTAPKPQQSFVPETPKPVAAKPTTTTTTKTVKADDRIIIKSAPSKPVKNVPAQHQTNNPGNDDAIFYACQSVNDYESYLNSFPNGRHRAAAQNAINSLLGRNTNVANGAVPVNDISPRRRVAQDPPITFREEVPPPRRSNYGSNYGGGHRQPSRSYGSQGGGMRNSGMRSGGSQRSGSYSGGSSNRHARSH